MIHFNFFKTGKIAANSSKMHLVNDRSLLAVTSLIRLHLSYL